MKVLGAKEGVLPLPPNMQYTDLRYRSIHPKRCTVKCHSCGQITLYKRHLAEREVPLVGNLPDEFNNLFKGFWLLLSEFRENFSVNSYFFFLEISSKDAI